jgi:chromosome segregation ATPase
MNSRESLEKMSDDELGLVYRGKEKEFQRRSSKNKKFQELLKHKLKTKESKVKKLQEELDLLKAKHPDIVVVKQDFDDDPNVLKEKVLTLQKDLLNVQTQQIQLKKERKKLELDIVKQQADLKFLQKEFDELQTGDETKAEDTQTQSEKMELAVITSEYQSTHDLLDTLTLEIEHLHKRLHSRG